ncbi:hypothetical protein Aduo_004948 [Ancylostoma duodenale]
MGQYMDPVRSVSTPKHSSEMERLPRRCYKCGLHGHIARECTSEPRHEIPERDINALMSNDIRQEGSFSAWIDSLACSVSVSEVYQATNGLFGQKSLTDIGIMGKKVQSLLDTGSEMSIIPLSAFRTTHAEWIDLDAQVRRVPKVDVVIRNASGEVMSFADTVRYGWTSDCKT